MTDDTFRQRTTSNHPAVADVEQLATVLDQYTVTDHLDGEMTVHIFEERSGDYLVIDGEHCGFHPVPEETIVMSIPDPLNAEPCQFLAEVAACLAEPIVVQYTADDDGNYPLFADQWVAEPGDDPEDVVHTSFRDDRIEKLHPEIEEGDLVTFEPPGGSIANATVVAILDTGEAKLDDGRVMSTDDLKVVE